MIYFYKIVSSNLSSWYKTLSMLSKLVFFCLESKGLKFINVLFVVFKLVSYYQFEPVIANARLHALVIL